MRPHREEPDRLTMTPGALKAFHVRLQQPWMSERLQSTSRYPDAEASQSYALRVAFLARDAHAGGSAAIIGNVFDSGLRQVSFAVEKGIFGTEYRDERLTSMYGFPTLMHHPKFFAFEARNDFGDSVYPESARADLRHIWGLPAMHKRLSKTIKESMFRTPNYRMVDYPLMEKSRLMFEKARKRFPLGKSPLQMLSTYAAMTNPVRLNTPRMSEAVSIYVAKYAMFWADRFTLGQVRDGILLALATANLAFPQPDFYVESTYCGYRTGRATSSSLSRASSSWNLFVNESVAIFGPQVRVSLQGVFDLYSQHAGSVCRVGSGCRTASRAKRIVRFWINESLNLGLDHTSPDILGDREGFRIVAYSTLSSDEDFTIRNLGSPSDDSDKFGIWLPYTRCSRRMDRNHCVDSFVNPSGTFHGLSRLADWQDALRPMARGSRDAYRHVVLSHGDYRLKSRWVGPGAAGAPYSAPTDLDRAGCNGPYTRKVITG